MHFLVGKWKFSLWELSAPRVQSHIFIVFQSNLIFLKNVSAMLHKTSSPFSADAELKKKFMHYYFAISHPSRRFCGGWGEKHDGYRRKRELLGDDAEALWREGNLMTARSNKHLLPAHSSYWTVNWTYNIKLLNIILSIYLFWFYVFFCVCVIQIAALDLFHINVLNESTSLVFICVWFCVFCLFHCLWWI